MIRSPLPAVLHWSDLSAQERHQVLQRPARARTEALHARVREIIDAVRARGDAAVLDYTSRFDGVSLDSLEVSRAEFETALTALSTPQRQALERAIGNVQRFHEAQRTGTIRVETSAGVVCEQHQRVIEAVGLYVPAGVAPLPSACHHACCTGAPRGMHHPDHLHPATTRRLRRPSRADCRRTVWYRAGIQTSAVRRRSPPWPTARQVLGFDLDDSVHIPVERALSLFNRVSLMEIDLLYRTGLQGSEVAEHVKAALLDRHGSEDFTLTTQDQMLEVLGDVLRVLTLAVGALGGSSLGVGGIGILTIMTIAVRERRHEIGLLRALGAGQGEILGLFLAEAVVLAVLGGLAGLAIGAGGAWMIQQVLPALPTHIAWDYVALAELLAGLIGLAAGVTPAVRAARLDPVVVLHEE